MAIGCRRGKEVLQADVGLHCETLNGSGQFMDRIFEKARRH